MAETRQFDCPTCEQMRLFESVDETRRQERVPAGRAFIGQQEQLTVTVKRYRCPVCKRIETVEF